MSAVLDNARLRSAVASRGDDRLAPVRQAALARFEETGLPDTRHEDWRYTNLKPVIELGNRWLAATPTDRSTTQDIPWDEIVDAYWLAIRDGRPDATSLAALSEQLGTGVRLSLLSDTDAVPSLAMDDPVSSLNAALIDDGLFIEIAEGTRLDKPIGLALLDGSPSGVAQIRVVIHAAQGAEVDIVEWHSMADDVEHFASVVSQIDLCPSACVRYVKLQERGDNCLQISRTLATLGSDSRFEHASVDLGGRLVRNDVIATISGAGAAVSTAGVYLTDRQQHVDNHICVDHATGPATSRQVYRGIATGRSRCVFNGKAIVREGADGTDAEQSNHNLLLSERAEIDTKPELEIYADDVKCSHGATIGQLDKKALYYLRTRGLDEEQAAQVLTRAFAEQILSDIPIEAVRAYVEERMDKRLDQLVGDGS